MSDNVRKIPRPLEKNFGVAHFKYNRWSLDLTEEQTFDDVLVETFWAGLAEKMMGHDPANPKGIGDLIEVRKRDTAQFMELIVLAIGKGFVKVAPLRAYEPKAVSEPEASPLTTRWNPGKKCHEVIRKADKTVMSAGHQTKDAAVAWIADHVKAMAA